MISLTRSDQSVLGRWWWTVDRWTIAAVLVLIAFGLVLIQAATPAVAVRHGLDGFYFIERHVFLLVPALGFLFGLSLLSPPAIARAGWVLLVITLPLLIATLFLGQEIKGATRWLHLPGLSLQPSEFIKPAFAVVAAWLFAKQCETRSTTMLIINLALFAIIMVVLVSQPDIGMSALIGVIWFGQFFLAGLSPLLVMVAVIGAVGGLVVAYYSLPHFASRLDRFLTNTGDTYQIDRARDAFMNGGLLGTGPGEGTIKMSIPDVHADFIFAVAGEELGLLACILIIGLFVFIVLRGLMRVAKEQDLFVLLAASGLLAEFGLQAIINLASTTHLMPAKGMTLPFISYGGSSLLSVAVGMGMILALTRKRYGSSL